MPQHQFDASQFRLDALVDPNLITETLLTSITVRKPSKQPFIRVHPGEDYYRDVALLEDEQDRENYLVAASMLPDLEGEYRRVRLVVAMARNAVTPFLWPLKLPAVDGRSNLWNDSAMLAAQAAKSSWVRVVSDQSQGMYKTTATKGDWGDPDWPDTPMDELLEKAFKDRIITDTDHMVVRKLRGEA